jgi:hypothetical protein
MCVICVQGLGLDPHRNHFPLFVHYEVPLWVPEAGGAIDPERGARLDCNRELAAAADS